MIISLIPLVASYSSSRSATKINPDGMAFGIGLITIALIILALYIAYVVYRKRYYKSEEFLKIKESISDNTIKCNELNDHIEELKQAYIGAKNNEGNASIHDSSNFNFKRSHMNRWSDSSNFVSCTLTVVRNAKNQPFKYFCKYFNVKPDEETLERFENVLNDFSAAEQGKELLKKERDEIIASLKDKTPLLIRLFDMDNFVHMLGFNDIDFTTFYFPRYGFRYVSPGGNSSMSCDITFDIDNLDNFINYLANIVKFRKSVAGQRALMTSALREKIKQRDHYKCCKCKNSTEKEPNLLLEIDHIKPLAKGGMTTEDNLQTLCWKCNRAKGAKW